MQTKLSELMGIAVSPTEAKSVDIAVSAGKAEKPLEREYCYYNGGLIIGSDAVAICNLMGIDEPRDDIYAVQKLIAVNHIVLQSATDDCVRQIMKFDNGLYIAVDSFAETMTAVQTIFNPRDGHVETLVSKNGEAFQLVEIEENQHDQIRTLCAQMKTAFDMFAHEIEVEPSPGSEKRWVQKIVFN